MAGEHIISLLDNDPANPHGIGRFRMGGSDDKDLQNFIRRVARKSAKANLTTTYVACSAEAPGIVVGYITLMCAEVQLDGQSLIPDKPGADRYKRHPAVRIARLAVEGSAQRSGVGRKLLTVALGIIVDHIQPYVGCRFVILDSVKKSQDFYARHGFRHLDTVSNRSSPTSLMFLDLKNLA
mgnify:FL=1|jgi:predicted N-acetyltransferase YhbS